MRVWPQVWLKVSNHSQNVSKSGQTLTCYGFAKRNGGGGGNQFGHTGGDSSELHHLRFLQRAGCGRASSRCESPHPVQHHWHLPVVDEGRQARDPVQRSAATHPAMGERSDRFAMSRGCWCQEKLTPQPFALPRGNVCQPPAIRRLAGPAHVAGPPGVRRMYFNWVIKYRLK